MLLYRVLRLYPGRVIQYAQGPFQKGALFLFYSSIFVYVLRNSFHEIAVTLLYIHEWQNSD